VRKVTEREFKERLQSLSNQKIKALYENLDITHYPILLMIEYKRRFGRKIKARKKLKKKTERKKR